MYIYLLYLSILQLSKLRIKEENHDQENRKKKRIVRYLKHLPGTNFFFLYFLSRNVDFRFLQDLLKQISKEEPDRRDNVSDGQWLVNNGMDLQNFISLFEWMKNIYI